MLCLDSMIQNLNMKTAVIASALILATVHQVAADVRKDELAQDSSRPMNIIPRSGVEKPASNTGLVSRSLESDRPRAPAVQNRRREDLDLKHQNTSQKRAGPPAAEASSPTRRQPQERTKVNQTQEQDRKKSAAVGANTIPDSQEKSGPTNSTTSSQIESEEKLADAYCKAVQPSLSESLVSWQRQKLTELRTEIEQKLDDLAQRRSELEAAERRQQDASQRVQGNFVAILVKMRPDAAASQLAAMEESAAAALITKMDVRSAGVILNEIPASKAARLAELITGQKNVPSR